MTGTAQPCRRPGCRHLQKMKPSRAEHGKKGLRGIISLLPRRLPSSPGTRRTREHGPHEHAPQAGRPDRPRGTSPCPLLPEGRCPLGGRPRRAGGGAAPPRPGALGRNLQDLSQAGSPDSAARAQGSGKDPAGPWSGPARAVCAARLDPPVRRRPAGEPCSAWWPAAQPCLRAQAPQRPPSVTAPTCLARPPTPQVRSWLAGVRQLSGSRSRRRAGCSHGCAPVCRLHPVLGRGLVPTAALQVEPLPGTRVQGHRAQVALSVAQPLALLSHLAAGASALTRLCPGQVRGQRRRREQRGRHFAQDRQGQRQGLWLRRRVPGHQ